MSQNVTLITAPAGAGKSAAIIERLRQLPAGKALIVVPDRLQRDRMKQALDGIRRVHSSHFYQLINSVFRRLEYEPEKLSNSVRFGVIRSLIHQLVVAGRLPYLQQAYQKTGLISQIISVIDAIAEGNGDPSLLANADLCPYDAEIALIYETYFDWQLNSNCADEIGRVQLCAKALQSIPDLYSDYTLLVIDGFDQFPPIQLELFKALSQQIPETLITLTHDQSERPALHRFQRTFAALNKAFKPKLEPLALPEARNPVHLLPQRIFRHDQQPAIAHQGAFHFIEAADREREVRAVLRRAHALIEAGNQPEQLAIILRNEGEYTALLREVAQEYQLPLSMWHGQSLAQEPLVDALLSAFQLHLDNYPRRTLIDVLRARSQEHLPPKSLPEPLADPGLDWNWVAGQLDRLTRSQGIGSGYERMRQALIQQIEKDEEQIIFPEEMLDFQQVNLKQSDAQRLLSILEAFYAWITPPESATVEEYCTWVRLRSLGFGGLDLLKRAQAQTDPNLEQADEDLEEQDSHLQPLLNQIAEGFEGIFADLQAGARLLQRGPISAEAFLSELKGAIATTRYGHSKPKTGFVAVLPVLASRGLNFAHIFLLGLNEGEFPQTLPDPPLYSRRERLELKSRGLELSTPDPADEQSIFYEALTRARQSITFSRTYLDPSGNLIPPSPYLRAVQALVERSSNDTTRVQAGKIPSFAEAVGLSEQLIALADDDQDPRAASAAAQRLDPNLWQHVQAASAVEQMREYDQGFSSFEGVIDENDLIKQLAGKFGPNYTWSASQLNDYITCPYIFFGRHILKIQVPNEPEISLQERESAALSGLIEHAILAETVRRWRDQQLRLEPANEDELIALFHASADQVLGNAPASFRFEPDRFWQWDSATLKQRLERALRRSINEASAWSDFLPAAVEQAFGAEGVRPLELDTSAGRVKIKGRIDRVDQNPADGSIAIIDYKKGSGLRPLKDTSEGYDLQLPIYFMAAEQVLPLGKGQRVAQAAFFQLGSGKFSPPLTADQWLGVEAVVLERIADVLQHVREGDFRVQPRRDCPSYCKLSAICRVNTHKQET
jgi:ATP-dependent helicase/nuclease subunit B